LRPRGGHPLGRRDPRVEVLPQAPAGPRGPPRLPLARRRLRPDRDLEDEGPRRRPGGGGPGVALGIGIRQWAIGISPRITPPPALPPGEGGEGRSGYCLLPAAYCLGRSHEFHPYGA